MLTELCGYLKNWFEKAKYFGKFEIKDGVIVSFNDGNMDLLNNQYIRIVGSVLNDGVYQYHADGIEGLTDEAFDGSVWALAIPPAVVKLANEIKAWQAKYGGVDSAALSPYISENIPNVYSYTKVQGSENTGGGMFTSWQSVFSTRLRPWRKL